MFGEIRENKKARTFQYEHRILGGVFARCTVLDNKKVRTLVRTFNTLFGDLSRTRTCDLLIRSQTLYPAELRGHSAAWLSNIDIIAE